jgi:hypothetical protein
MLVMDVLVMTMIVMTVRMVMMVGVIVMMIVPVMRMALVMRVAGLGIGAAFGIERRFDLDDARAQAFHHRLDHVVAADAQALRHDLRRQMTVAEMPGEPHQMLRIDAADLDQRLGCRDHLDHPAVFQHKSVAAAQGDGVLEIEQECEPPRAGHHHSPPVPIVEIEHDGIGSSLSPVMLAQDARGADHAHILIRFSGHPPSQA